MANKNGESKMEANFLNVKRYFIQHLSIIVGVDNHQLSVDSNQILRYFQSHFVPIYLLLKLSRFNLYMYISCLPKKKMAKINYFSLTFNEKISL